MESASFIQSNNTFCQSFIYLIILLSALLHFALYSIQATTVAKFRFIICSWSLKMKKEEQWIGFSFFCLWLPSDVYPSVSFHSRSLCENSVRWQLIDNSVCVMSYRISKIKQTFIDEWKWNYMPKQMQAWSAKSNRTWLLLFFFVLCAKNNCCTIILSFPFPFSVSFFFYLGRLSRKWSYIKYKICTQLASTFYLLIR